MKKIIRLILLIIFIPSFICAKEKINISNNTSLNIIYKYDDISLSRVNVDIYHLASIDEDGNYNVLEKFINYGIDINDIDNWENMSDTIVSFIQRDNIFPDYSYVTNHDGEISINNLPVGVYFITSNKLYSNGYTYVPKATIISIPTFINDKWEYKLTTIPKVSRMNEEVNNKYVSKRVMISWVDDNEYLSVRPLMLKVKLLRDGVEFDEVILNQENNWRYNWQNLMAFNPEGEMYVYSVVLSDLDNYNVNVSSLGSTFSITNTYIKSKEVFEEELKEESLDKLPYTGLLLWPIPIIFMLGFILLILGIRYLYYKKDNDKDKNKTRKRGETLIIVGDILIACSSLMLIFNLYCNYKIIEKRNKIYPLIEDKILENNNLEYPDYYYNPNINMPISNIDDKNYIGILNIDSLGIRIPILESWNYKNYFPAKYSGSAYLNNMVIAGYNYSSHFGRLTNLKLGDLVEFKDLDGNIFKYRVSEVLTLGYNQSFEMKNSEWDLTLFTCDFSCMGRRTTYRCEKIKNM